MISTCELCEGNYESLRGLRIHQSSVVLFYLFILNFDMANLLNFKNM